MTSNPSIAARAVIVTADDFGFSREVNAGIIRAHREGILTATSLMVAAAARDEAAALARENPKLDVGLHLVVCRGHSALPPESSCRHRRCLWKFSRKPRACRHALLLQPRPSGQVAR